LKGGDADDEKSTIESEASDVRSVSTVSSKKSGKAAAPKPFAQPLQTTILKRPFESEVMGAAEQAIDVAAVQVKKRNSEDRTASRVINLGLSPSLTLSTPALTPSTVFESISQPSTAGPATPPTVKLPTVATPTPQLTSKATKIFVSKGESPDRRISEGLKRPARQYARRGAPVSTLPPSALLDKQIQQVKKAETRRAQADRKRETDCKEKDEDGGLLASRHAHSPRGEREMKQLTSAGRGR
jgi:hypothetical protein